MLAIAGQSTRSLTLSLFVCVSLSLLAFSFSVLHQNTINQFMVNSKILMHIYTILILSLSIRLWRQPKIQLSLSRTTNNTSRINNFANYALFSTSLTLATCEWNNRKWFGMPLTPSSTFKWTWIMRCWFSRYISPCTHFACNSAGENETMEKIKFSFEN